MTASTGMITATTPSGAHPLGLLPETERRPAVHAADRPRLVVTAKIDVAAPTAQTPTVPSARHTGGSARSGQNTGTTAVMRRVAVFPAYTTLRHVLAGDDGGDVGANALKVQMKAAMKFTFGVAGSSGA